MNTTIVCFSLPRPGGDVDAISVDSDGKFLTGQICSSATWAEHDLANSESKFHMWFYDRRYPEEWQIFWMDHPPHNWDGQREHTEESIKAYHDANPT